MGDFTVADGYLFTVLNWTKFHNIDLSAFPNITAFMKRVAARPAVQEAMKAEGLLKAARRFADLPTRTVSPPALRCWAAIPPRFRGGWIARSAPGGVEPANAYVKCIRRPHPTSP